MCNFLCAASGGAPFGECLWAGRLRRPAHRHSPNNIANRAAVRIQKKLHIADEEAAKNKMVQFETYLKWFQVYGLFMSNCYYLPSGLLGIVKGSPCNRYCAKCLPALKENDYITPCASFCAAAGGTKTCTWR